MNMNPLKKTRRVGFVATRIAGTDGVSLETAKWAEVLEAMGFECYFIAGESDRPAERTVLIEEARFTHPTIADINRQAFATEQRSEALTNVIVETAGRIRGQLKAAIADKQLDLIIPENSLTIPMNIPLGLAIVYVVQELGIPCIAHHHDFYWERERFLSNAVGDFLSAAFPPNLKTIHHAVINTQAAEELSRRTGISCRIIPNVMNFEQPPSAIDDYARQFRRCVGLTDEDLLILQPTRVVERKGIERSIELVRYLDDPRAKLVITHATGDEGDGYARHIRRFAEVMGVELIFADRWISDRRSETANGQPTFTIEDVYPQADLVTYPSSYEGFGNAFLEAVYFRKPIVCNRYAIFQTDIEPCGFRTIRLDGFVEDAAIAETRRVLADAVYRQEIVDHNFELGRRFFSYDLVERELRSLLHSPRVECGCPTTETLASGCAEDGCHCG